MAALSTTNPTLVDLAKRTAPDGSIDTIVEILNQENEIIQDATFIEGNLPTGHRTTVRSGLPAPTWRKLYGGVQPSKSRTVQVTDTCGMLEAYAEVDKALADLNGNTREFRLSEDRSYIEAMAQEVASTMFYGSASTPEEFVGLAERYGSISGAENAINIIDAAGNDTDLTSMFLVVWSTGSSGIHGIVPKGSKAGLQVTDKGQITIENVDGAGGRMEAYRTHYRWDVGLTVRDWRQAGRIANIELSALETLSNTKNLITWMIQLSERINKLSAGRAVWYCNKTIREKLRLGILEKVSTNLTWETVAGKPVMMFDGIPVRRCDAIISTESRVV